MQTEEPVDEPVVGTPEETQFIQTEEPDVVPIENASPQVQEPTDKFSAVKPEDAHTQTGKSVDGPTVVGTEGTSSQIEESVEEPAVVTATDVPAQKEKPVDEPVVRTLDGVEHQPQSWHALVLPWWKAMLAILPIFLLTRFIFLLLIYLGGVLFTAANFAATTVSYHDLLANLNRGDVTNYITIATSGYTQPGQTILFPLFPTLIRAVAPLFRHSQLIASFFLANLAFLGALIVLYLLVESEFDRDTAKRTSLYIAIFPASYVFFMGYSESLFLFFVLLSFYCIRRSSWWLGGLFGALASLTQFAGIFLLVVFLYEYIHQEGPQIRHAWQEDLWQRRVRPILPALAALFIPLALILYFSALGSLFGDPFMFTRVQSQNGAGFSGLFSALKTLVEQPHLSAEVAHTLLEGAAFLLFALLLVLCFYGPERLEKSQWAFALLGVLLLLSALLFTRNVAQDSAFNEPLALIPRLVASIFPGFIVLARFGRRRSIHTAYLLLALPLLAFFVLQFLTGQWLL